MLDLPKKDKDLVDLMNFLRNQGEMEAARFRVRWQMVRHWLMGARRFYPDFDKGEVDAVYDLGQQNSTGHLQLLYEEVLVRWQAEMGRLMRMDLRPAVNRKGFGLTRLRKAATARVELDFLTSGVPFNQLKFDMMYNLTLFGTAGVGSWVNTRSTDEDMPEQTGIPGEGLPLGRTPESKIVMEVIPPWQLLPVPHRTSVQSDVEGIIRKRWVPLDWLRRRPGLTLTSDEAAMGVRMAPYGQKPGDEVEGSPSVSTSQSVFRSFRQAMSIGGVGRKTDGLQTKYVLLEEMWSLMDERDRLASYVVKVGDHIALRQDHSELGTYMPIGVAQYHPVTGFYGRGFVELLIPVNAEVEQMARNLFQNVKDLDNFGMLFVPHGMGVTRREVEEQRGRRKVVFFTPDQTLPESKPFPISPVNTGDMPGKVMAFGNQLIDRLSNQSPLYQGNAPGRVDSESGLSLLHQTSNIPLSVPADSVERAVVQAYKAILGMAPGLLGSRRDLPLLGLDDGLLGLRVRAAEGVVELDPAAFPMPHEVELRIQDSLPTLPILEENKIKEALKLGVIDHRGFRLECLRRNIEYPTGNYAEMESWRKSMLGCLLLFNDGETPGPAMASSDADLPDVCLGVIQTFMAKPEFQFASEAVRAEFENMKQFYLTALGKNLPDAMPYPEDAAVMAKAGPSPGLGGLAGLMGAGLGGPVSGPPIG